MNEPETMLAIRMGLASLGTLRVDELADDWWHARLERAKGSTSGLGHGGKGHSEEKAIRILWAKAKPFAVKPDLASIG